jgi:hypothetical protein
MLRNSNTLLIFQEEGHQEDGGQEEAGQEEDDQ